MSILLHFPQGLPGFESYHNFYFVPEEDTLLAQMRAVDDERIGFVLLKPQFFFPTYNPVFDIDDQSADLLKVKPETKVEVWAIVTLKNGDLHNTTANLRAPLLINLQDKIGLQHILNNDKYLSRQPLLTDNNQGETGEGAVD
jgi:flagellar assembly factor FliW